MHTLKILACQIAIPDTVNTDDRDRHVARLAELIGSSLEREHHDLVVLPELSTVDYSRASFDNLGELAEPVDGPSFQAFSALARKFGCFIVYGMPRVDDGVFRISQIAIDSEGRRIGYFDKLHIAQYGASMEKEYFERGDHLFTFKCRGVNIAPIICYDIRIPELTRVLAVDHNVDLILHCGAYARDESFYSWHHFAVTRALENQVFLLSLNRAGTNFGNSLFCSPWVDESNPELHFADTAEELRTITMDTQRMVEARDKYTFLLDRLKSYDLTRR